MSEIDWNEEYWISVRNRWPRKPGKYKVYDCRNDYMGTATYDGFEFHDIQVKKGNLMLVTLFITHWQENE